jgi:ferritin-like metal-binding protein YciE
MKQKELVLQYLSEAHALETALVTNLTAHSAMTPSGAYKTLLERHLTTTREHAKNVERRINELGDDVDKGIVTKAAELARDAVGQALVLTKGPIDMVRGMGMNEKLLKNAKDEVTTEAQEIATYDALEAAAKAAGDEKTAKLAADHRSDEEAMLKALRREIPKLALADVKERTDGPVVTTSARSTTTRRTPAGRTTSTKRASTSTNRSTAAKKAGAAKKTTTRRSATSRAKKS